MTTFTLEGDLKFWSKDKGFGFVVTPEGDAFVHASIVGEHLPDMQKEGAVISLEAVKKFEEGKFRLTATAVLKVTLPEVRTVWACVRTYNEEKRIGTVNLGEIDLLEQTAFVPRKVIEQSGFVPGIGMPMLARIKLTKAGWDVVSFDTGPDILVEYRKYMDEMTKLAKQAEATAATAAADTAVAEPQLADNPKPKRTRKPRQSQPVGKPTLKETVAACAATAGSTAMAEALAGAVLH